MNQIIRMTFSSVKNIVKSITPPAPQKSRNGRIKQWAYNISGFRKYGLMRDDLLDEEFNEDVARALKRLPEKLYYERCYRRIRAFQLSLMFETLPECEWMTLEKDVLYLKPYVDEIRREREEHEEWNKYD